MKYRWKALVHSRWQEKRGEDILYIAVDTDKQGELEIESGQVALLSVAELLRNEGNIIHFELERISETV